MPKIYLKTPITYYGGKQRLCARIIDVVPEHNLYCEPFLGGAAVFFAKPPSTVEVLNDTNRELINFYRVVQNDFVSLEKMIRITLHSRDLFEEASVIYNHPRMFNEIKRAWAVWVLSCQGFAGQLDSSWGYERKSDKTGKKIINNRDRFTEDYAIRLQNVQLECADALYVIKSRDSESSFFYCDPPYVGSDCGHYDGYTDMDFEALLTLLASIKGKFLLSSYPNKTLQAFVKQNGWHQWSIEQSVSVNNKGGKRKAKTEVLTANYPFD
ncbi:DNA adenine methylase [Pelobium manganitolerans]|uniref:DNA adenine methylase n=1 Tax=Pelobium manganitolerans TaxID=1842495 RepID=UPI003FA3CC1B